MCDGTTTLVDLTGVCCPSNVADASGACCASGAVDACGVCDGGGASCTVSASVTVTVTSTEGLDDSTSPEYVAFVESFASSMAEALGVDTSRVVVTAVTVQPAAADDEGDARRRALLQTSGDVTVDFQVLPGADGTVIVETSTLQGVIGVMIATTPAEGATFELTSAEAVGASGTCGNDACESGEGCSSSDDLADCCLADCPVVPLACPLGREGAAVACGGRGRCDQTTGVCACFAGASGAACGACAAGWSASESEDGDDTGGDVVVCVPNEPVWPPPSPPSPSPPPSPAPPPPPPQPEVPNAPKPPPPGSPASESSMEALVNESWFWPAVGGGAGGLVVAACVLVVLRRTYRFAIDRSPSDVRDDTALVSHQSYDMPVAPMDFDFDEEEGGGQSSRLGARKAPGLVTEESDLIEITEDDLEDIRD